MAALGRPVEIDILPGRRHYTALSQMADPSDPTLKLLVDFVHRLTR
jgi:hypothetical protein